ncbi:MAG: hypothetical protein E4G98_07085 [Promethearchaeota archaeon]|nr:MAG: hypothetical protein E4G98_07085 [Candidatus Lokiarchaeota archaeon]
MSIIRKKQTLFLIIIICIGSISVFPKLSRAAAWSNTLYCGVGSLVVDLDPQNNRGSNEVH